MDFAQVESEFRRAKAAFERGTLTEAEFRAEVEELMIEDQNGRWWIIGYETGLWYFNDGEKWVQQEPPRSDAMSRPSLPEREADTGPAPDLPPEPAMTVVPETGAKQGSDWASVLLASGGSLIAVGGASLLQQSISDSTLVYLLLGTGFGIGGLIIALALKRAGLRIAWRQVAAIVAGCVLSVGFLGGLATALALRRGRPGIHGKDLAITLTLGWAVGWGIGFAVAALVGDSPMIAGALWGGIFGAVASWVTLRQLGRSYSLTPAESAP